MTTVTEVRLKSRPKGLPTRDNFEFAKVELRDPGPGEIQVKNLWMTVDPYMRGRMNDVKSYAPPFALGETMNGGAIGEVVKSNDPGFKEGDLVTNQYGWREGFTAAANTVQKLDPRGLPVQAFLGVAGMPGLTAYAGLLRIAALKDGDVVFVSGAAGAVGSLVCQIAKAKGHKVVGSAGGPEKVKFLKEIGVDHAIDYKAEKDLTAAVLAGAPDGIDVYFENVGGKVLEAVAPLLNAGSRVPICGFISQYNEENPVSPFTVLGALATPPVHRFFLVWEWPDEYPSAVEKLAGWVREGKLKYTEDVTEGLEQAPRALIGVLRGENFGKKIIKIDPAAP